MIKVCVTTSDKYHHLLPIFFYLYNRYWGAPFDLVGHAKPECDLPDNCTWVSLGEQTGPQDWSTQLRPYFERQPDWFIWMMEDTILKEVRQPFVFNPGEFDHVGKIDLTDNITKRPHTVTYRGILAHPTSNYRLSTQPAMWNRDYLLKWLKPGMSPWQFEKQDAYDGYDVLGFITPAVIHNEGVRKDDLYKVDLNGLPDEDIAYIKSIAPWLK